jgi:hypothetical protein
MLGLWNWNIIETPLTRWSKAVRECQRVEMIDQYKLGVRERLAKLRGERRSGMGLRVFRKSICESPEPETWKAYLEAVRGYEVFIVCR